MLIDQIGAFACETYAYARGSPGRGKVDGAPVQNAVQGSHPEQYNSVCRSERTRIACHRPFSICAVS